MMEESEEPIPIWWPLIPIPELEPVPVESALRYQVAATLDPLTVERLLYDHIDLYDNGKLDALQGASLAAFIVNLTLNLMLFANTFQSHFNSYFRALQYGSLLGAQVLAFYNSSTAYSQIPSLQSLFLIFEGVRAVPSNHFIGGLAISNTLISIHFIIFNFALEQLSGPDALCDFAVYGGIIFCASSNMSRVAIAVDRYIFISDPLRYYQRTQTSCHMFGISGIFVMCVALIVTPYAFILRTDSSQISCLPAYPKVYLACVVCLLMIVPSIMLIIIYTRIFYWAFMQMQILRQEAKHFLCKRENMAPSAKRSQPSSFTSKQMRVYTGAAILLTPTSPFSSIKESIDLSSVPSMETSNIQTTVHTIVHILSGLRDRQRKSTVSTSVDVAGTYDSGNSTKNLVVPSTALSPTVSSKVDNTNENYHVVDYKKASVISLSQAVAGNSTAVDRLFGPSLMGDLGGPCVGPSRGVTRGYVPVTQHGKLMESQVRTFDTEAGRRPSMDSQQLDMGQGLMCKLLKAEVKAAVMIMALVGSFIICWTPFIIMEIICIFELEEVTTLEKRLAVLLIVVNCALDPFTYALMNPPFRAIVYRSIHMFIRRYRQSYDLPSQTCIRKLPKKSLIV